METDKVVGYIVAIAGVIVALVAATIPLFVAIVNKRRAVPDAKEVAPVMGMPVPVDTERDAYLMVTTELAAKKVEAALLSTQLNAAYVGWRGTQSSLDEANRRLVAAGLPPVT